MLVDVESDPGHHIFLCLARCRSRRIRVRGIYNDATLGGVLALYLALIGAVRDLIGAGCGALARRYFRIKSDIVIRRMRLLLLPVVHAMIRLKPSAALGVLGIHHAYARHSSVCDGLLLLLESQQRFIVVWRSLPLGLVRLLPRVFSCGFIRLQRCLSFGFGLYQFRLDIGCERLSRIECCLRPGVALPGL